MDARLAFILGALVGGFLMRNKMKNEIEQEASMIAQEEINDYIRGFEKHNKDNDTVKKEETTQPKEPETVNESTSTRAVPSFQKFFDDKGSNSEYELISKDEFDESEELDKNSYTYYQKDKVVTDENNRRTDSFNNFNIPALFEDEDTDVIYVKNEELSIYYEIVRDYRSYSEVLKLEPHLEGLDERYIR